MKRMVTVILILLFLPAFILAATTGRIKGKVTDLQTGEPLIGANILVVGTSLGAATNVNGDFTITNLEAGTYEVRASYVGYQTITVSNVRVSSDLTTEQNFQLPAEGITTEEVQVVALRPLVNKSNTNAQRITTSEDIEALPVRGIDNILALTPGVVLQDNTVFIRGGRQDEVGYYLEGTNISDPMVGGRAVTLVQDAVEEIQVQAGGYNAEFGGANAGIIRQQIKSGTPDFKASLEYITDNIGFNGRGDRFSGEKTLGAHWFGYTDFIATFSGPVIDKKFRFFGLLNYNYINDQNPQPYPGINLGVIGDPNTHDSINFSYPAGPIFKNSAQNVTGTGTITLDFNPLIFRLVGSYTAGKTYNPWSSHRNPGNLANILNLDRIENVETNDGAFNLKATHILNSTTYYELNAGYAFSGLDRFDPYLNDDFLNYGDSVANANAGVIWTRRPTGTDTRFQRPTRFSIFDFAFNAPGEVVAGYQKYKRETLNLSAALSTQLGQAHAIKVGGELQMFTIRNFSFGNEGVFALAGLFNENNKLPEGSRATAEEIIYGRGVNNFGYDAMGNEYTGSDELLKAKKPMFMAFYLQDKIEYNDLIINIGLRYDYIDVDNKEFADPAMPDLALDKDDPSIIKLDGYKDVPTFSAVSPRLGFSFPVTDQTVFHAQFGKFVQQTRLRDIYQGYYATSYNLGGGFEITAPVGFNIRPTRTTQYEIGFTQQIGDFASFDITAFYKDIQDQVVFEKQVVADNSRFADYNFLTNGDFATTKGMEVSFNMRRTERLQVNGSVSFQDAQGTGSFPNSARGIVGAPAENRIFKPQYISPLEYNNAFKGNINFDYRWAQNDGPSILHDFGISALLKFNSGHPYTQGIGGPDLEGDARDRIPVEALNASTTPWTYQVDLRLEKGFDIFDKLNANIYLYVINLFDTRNVENVFLRTGSTTDDGYLSDPNLGGPLVASNGPDFERLYNAINIDYYEQYQRAVTGAPYTTTPFFYGPPRQIRLGVRFEY